MTQRARRYKVTSTCRVAGVHSSTPKGPDDDMGITALSGGVVAPPAAGQPRSADRWVQPSGGPTSGSFDKALRAASAGWHPERDVVDPAPIEEAVRHALPLVLEAWRAIDRELSDAAVVSPEREVLEANAAMLRAVYQRLYIERARR